MNIAEYLAAVDAKLYALEGIIVTCKIERRIDTHLCLGFIKGRIKFIDGSTLEFSEQLPVLRQKFRFHYMDAHNALIARWDSAPHHRTSQTFPFHQHTPQGIQDHSALTLLEALHVIAARLAH